jgi:hypothetical protein
MDTPETAEFDADMKILFDAACSIAHFVDKYEGLLINVVLKDSASQADRNTTHMWAVLHDLKVKNKIISEEVKV